MSAKKAANAKPQPNSRRLNWRNSRKRIPRVFKLAMDVSLSRYLPLVEDVLDKIENDTLLVFRPDDEQAVHEVVNAAGAILVNQRATLPINIREWLPVGCQRITRGVSNRSKPNILAYYRHNGGETLFPETDEEPPGPAAFSGRIYLQAAAFPNEKTEEAHDAFRFVVAHELVHVFDAMRFVVPAVMDWTSFWDRVLDQGMKCHMLRNCLEDKGEFLDSYGTENELMMVEEFWPSRAGKWFLASNAVHCLNKLQQKRG